MEKQTAGHEQLGEFAPKFAELNDDILFDTPIFSFNVSIEIIGVTVNLKNY